MGNWQEKMREIEETERQRLEMQENNRIIKQQENQLALEANEKLRKNAEIQSREQGAKFFGIFDRLNVRQSLKDIRNKVWQNQGIVLEEKTDLARTIKLYFEYKTKIPENVRLGWTEKESRGYTSQGGNYYSSIEDVWKYKTEIAAWHDAIKPSYLEIGVALQSRNQYPAVLYVLDTNVQVDIPWSLAEEVRSNKAGYICNTFNRDVYYKDKSGGIFHKEPHNDKKHSNSSKEYSIEHKIMIFGAAFELTPSTSDKLISEFLDIGLASSCAKRKSEGKLPF
jgi:hypothetical protein